MEKLFVFLFWFFVSLYLLRLVLRYTMPYLIKRFFKKMQNQAKGFSPQDAYEQTHYKKKGMDIKYTKPQKAASDDDFGEYVDFEEIIDNDKHEDDE